MTAGVEILSVTGTPTISTAVHRAGAAALRINPTAAAQYVEQQITGGGGAQRTFHRFYLYIAAAPAATMDVYGIGQSGSSPHRVRLHANRTLQLYDSLAAANVGTASAALSLNTWYRIEVDDQDAFPGPGTITGYLDGVQFGTGSITAINASSNSGFSRVRVGAQASSTADVFIDDIAVNDTAGSAQTGLPGPGHVVHLRPDSAGDNAGFATTVGGSSNWGRVSETTPDDATTYNATTATGTTTIDDFNLGSTSAAGISGERVTLVAVGGRIGSDAATAASIVYRIKSQAAGTVAESGSVSVALNNWATHKAAAPFVPQLTSYTDPQAGGAWTTALLDQAQIGYRSNVSQATTRRVSALWALVETVPLTAAALGTASETDTCQAPSRSKTQALGTATESGAAQALAPLAGTPLAELVDDFDDNTIDTGLWPNSFGTVSETGGRARIPCDAGYNAYSSALEYTLANSSVSLRAYAPAGGGATTEAWAQMLIKSATGGTDLGFELRMTTDELICFSRTGYFDPGEVDIPYSATDHAWLRVRESGGTTYWDTSPDGTTWTNRRAESSPAWVGDVDLEFQLIAHRSDGVDDYVEFDNVNIAPSGGTTPLDPAAETATAQSLPGRKAQALGPAAETGTAQAPGRARARALTQAAATEIGQALARAKRQTLGIAAEVGAGQALTRAKRTTLTLAAEADAGQTVARAKRRTAVQAAETDTGQPVTRRKTWAAGPASETATALPVIGAKRLALGAAEETGTAREVAGASGLQPTEETSAALAVGRAKTRSVGVAGEVGTARPFGQAKAAALGGVAETATARPLTGGRSRALAPAEETCTARPLGTVRARQLPTATATDQALGLSPISAGQLPAAGETDTARPATGSKTRALTASAVVESAQPLAGRKTTTLGTALETSAGRSLPGGKRAGLVLALEVTEAQRLLIPGAVASAEETTAARSLARGKRWSLVQAAAVDEVLQLGKQARQLLGRDTESAEALQPGMRKVRALARADVTAAARPLISVKRRSLGVALEMDRALIGPKIRLTQAIDRTQALALTGQRQRPADALDATTSGPSLVTSTSGPGLTTSSSGPRLVASSTKGG
ncbi:hypothetical protein [Streptomyces cadmiisoli]|uniref:hypothetical protein n=1 Tax=Streptomyces cadmiisoli TaxID=2184053 RepID=UPI003D71533B